MRTRRAWPRWAAVLVLGIAVAWALTNRQQFDPAALERTMRDRARPDDQRRE